MTDPERNLAQHLEEQIYFLHEGANGFDRGADVEGKALALRLRILFHQTRASDALVNQLGLRDSLRMYDTAIPIDVDGTPTGKSVLTALHLSSGRYVAKLDWDAHEGYGYVDVDTWWHRPIIVDGFGYTLTRESLVLAMANQDGGAHVGAELNEVYQRLRDVGTGLRVGGEWSHSKAATPVYAAVRQAAYECLVSLAHHPDCRFPSTVPRRRYRYLDGFSMEEVYGRNSLYIGDSKIDVVDEHGQPAIHEPNAGWPDGIGRNDTCPCGSGEKFKKCHGC